MAGQYYIKDIDVLDKITKRSDLPSSENIQFVVPKESCPFNADLKENGIATPEGTISSFSFKYNDQTHYFLAKNQLPQISAAADRVIFSDAIQLTEGYGNSTGIALASNVFYLTSNYIYYWAYYTNEADLIPKYKLSYRSHGLSNDTYFMLIGAGGGGGYGEYHMTWVDNKPSSGGGGGAGGSTIFGKLRLNELNGYLSSDDQNILKTCYANKTLPETLESNCLMIKFGYGGNGATESVSIGGTGETSFITAYFDGVRYDDVFEAQGGYGGISYRETNGCPGGIGRAAYSNIPDTLSDVMKLIAKSSGGDGGYGFEEANINTELLKGKGRPSITISISGVSLSKFYGSQNTPGTGHTNPGGGGGDTLYGGSYGCGGEGGGVNTGGSRSNGKSGSYGGCILFK